MAPIIKRHKSDGIDWAEKVIEASGSHEFSYPESVRSIRSLNEGRNLRETITLSQVASAIDLTTMNALFNDYEAYPALYEAIAEITTSNSIMEEYPEDWADDLPAKISELEEAPEARITNTSYRITNFVYGRILSISKRAYDNDNRGWIKNKVSNFAQNYKKVIDRAFIYTMFRQLTSSNINLPTTNLLGSNSIVASTAGKITPQRIQDAFTLSAFIADPFGEYITANFNTLVCDSADRLNAMRFLNSLYSPTGFPSGSTGYDVDQSPGPFSENILKGLLTVAHSPYVKSSRSAIGGSGLPALLMESKRGQVVQMRQNLQVTMEDANAGKSFLQRSYNWQGTMEFGTGNRNPRLFIIIN
jgi:hypothetical protein